MLKFWKDITVKALEEELQKCKENSDRYLESWTRATDRVWDAHVKINEMEAELVKAKEENEQLRNEVVELKAKYTEEVLKNYELVKRCEAEGQTEYERFMNQLKEV